MRAAWKSDRGLVRENNEDSVLVDAENGIFLLADGMGGGPAGEVASQLAVTTAHGALRPLFRDDGLQVEAVPRLLAGVMATVHSTVFRKTLAEPALAGMGTTLDMAIVRGETVVICHVGDSRVYLYRQKRVRQITTDDNYAAVLAASGNVAPHAIPAHYRHILTQAVGVSDELVPEFHTPGIRPGELILMCSDGLTAALTDPEIGEVISRNEEHFDSIPVALVNAANARGGPDNVSVVIIDPLPVRIPPGPPKGALLIR